MRKRGWGRVAPLLVVTMAVAGLAACSGEDSPPAASPVTSPTEPSESATPTPTPTPRPSKLAAAKQPTPEGAQEFVKYFLQIYTYAYATNDWIPVSDVSLPGCNYCKSIVDNVRQQRADGVRVVGESLRPLDVLARPGGGEDRTIVDATYSESASRVVSNTGRVIESYSASKAQFMTIALRWDIRVGWRVIAAKVEDGPN